MTLFSLATLGALGLIVGVFIGGIGIGGVMLVPALSYLGGIPIPTALAAAMMGYLLTGAVGAAIYARRKSIRWSMALWLCAGAMPAALAGAWTSNNVPPVYLELCIGMLTASAGVHAIMGMHKPGEQGRALSRPVLVLIGVVTGFFGVTRDALASRSRRRDVLLPRQLAMYLCRRYSDAALAEIARAFGRDHPSVSNAEKAIERRILERAHPTTGCHQKRVQEASSRSRTQ